MLDLLMILCLNFEGTDIPLDSNLFHPLLLLCPVPGLLLRQPGTFPAGRHTTADL